MSIDRREFLKAAGIIPALALDPIKTLTDLSIQQIPFQRVRPGDTGWPSLSAWNKLQDQVNGNLIKLDSPFDNCKSASSCTELFKNLKNPYFIGDNPALTQTTGWIDAWQTESSAYAVAAKSTRDIVAAVNFARIHKLRLVVKGGGHSYQGTSSSADSLLIWTRGMNAIELHDDFTGINCSGKISPQPAVSLGAGVIWMHAYDAVTTKGGRYVQGGGCGTVGVAGLIQSGGFGSFSKNYGLAAASLLEAEIVLADGSVKIVNPCSYPDLFWALKGGGGGTIGVITRLTLRTHELPEKFGAVFFDVRAKNEEAFRDLIRLSMDFYRQYLFNPNWGEKMSYHGNNTLSVSMLFQGLDRTKATEIWKNFEQKISGDGDLYEIKNPLTIIELPARQLWNPEFLMKNAPGVILTDNRESASPKNVYWATNEGEAGWFLHGYHSAWMPQDLLNDARIDGLIQAIFEATRKWSLEMHYNKGLAGAPPDALKAARDTAINPVVLDSFALAIIAGEGSPARPGSDGFEPDIPLARNNAVRIADAMEALTKQVSNPGAYYSESNYFQENWQEAFWGDNYSRLAAVKKKFDPEGLFFVHHGVGSEEWSADGFSKKG